jgi:hypothetical protein
MRLALACLLVAVATASVQAQGSQKQSPQETQEMLRQRLLLRERFNKGWDVQMENAQYRIEGRCKAEAMKKFSALHPLKRRKYTRGCIRRLRH